MKVTEVEIRLAEGGNDRILAFACFVVDSAFVVREAKVLQTNEGLRVAMPSRKLTDRCPGCESKNFLSNRFCGQCGRRLSDHRAVWDASGRLKLHADICHPINAATRKEIEDAILAAYSLELSKAELASSQRVPA